MNLKEFLIVYIEEKKEKSFCCSKEKSYFCTKNMFSRKFYLSFMLALSFLLCSDTAMVWAKKKNPKFKLVFREEFNLPDGSQPNPKLWSRVPRAKNLWAKWNSDTADVVFIRNGRLVCRVIPNTNPADTAMMLAGAVFTKHKFAFKYGMLFR